ncbi:MAG TPA: class I SAM-dependent methyltransferase [Ignavibacteria bacterium]|nr:class I SAM-dependent methyltransferase [Ignavibacteria bacterium]HMR38826.1 class I SAM-dependent methyltransferase [Ignavibacteria bacterium]
MSKVFDAYAKYYNLLYKGKNYKKETEYVLKFIRKYKPDARSILDLGCGTGRHDLLFSRKGFKTTGVELSPRMYSAAREILNENKNEELSLKFYNGDIRKIKLLSKFDVIISLFHVINYQTTNEDLESIFKTVKNHLKKDGLFIFDFWYGPAVLSDRPLKKTKIIKSDEIQITRHTVPEMKVNENLAVINFKVEVKDLQTQRIKKFNEKHNMRYLFLPEIESLCGKFELESIYAKEWLTGKNLSDKTWYGFTVLKNQN